MNLQTEAKNDRMIEETDLNSPKLKQISLGNNSFMEPSDRSLNPAETATAHLEALEKKHMRLQKRMIVVE